MGLQATFDESSSQLSGSDKVWTLHLDPRPERPQDSVDIPSAAGSSAESGEGAGVAGASASLTHPGTGVADGASAPAEGEEGSIAQAAEVGSKSDTYDLEEAILQLEDEGGGVVADATDASVAATASVGAEATGELEEGGGGVAATEGEEVGEEEGSVLEGVMEVASWERSKEEEAADTLANTDSEMMGATFTVLLYVPTSHFLVLQRSPDDQERLNSTATTRCS